MKTQKSKIIIYIITVILSLVYIFGCGSYTSQNLELFNNENSLSVKATVTKISRSEELPNPYVAEAEPDTLIHFNVEFKSGEQKGETGTALQLIDGYMKNVTHPVKKGDSVYLYYATDGEYMGGWMFADFNRLDKIIALAVIFFIALIIFGRFQGFNTIVSLSLTCAAVIFVFIPAVLNGKNIYLWAILTCIFTIVMTLIVVYGITKKSIGAALGCFAGVGLAGTLAIIMDKFLNLTGYLNSDSYQLTMLGINIRGVIFGAIIIGAMGAIMDIAISISSSLYEVREKAESIIPSDLILSGFTIGRDILGTMSNTLVLAYIGSSLSVILVLAVYSPSPLELLNRESIIIELLQSLVGIIAILGTIPLTSVLCSFLYGGKNEAAYLTTKNFHQEEE